MFKLPVNQLTCTSFIKTGFVGVRAQYQHAWVVPTYASGHLRVMLPANRTTLINNAPDTVGRVGVPIPAWVIIANYTAQIISPLSLPLVSLVFLCSWIFYCWIVSGWPRNQNKFEQQEIIITIFNHTMMIWMQVLNKTLYSR